MYRYQGSKLKISWQLFPPNARGNQKKAPFILLTRSSISLKKGILKRMHPSKSANNTNGNGPSGKLLSQVARRKKCSAASSCLFAELRKTIFHLLE